MQKILVAIIASAVVVAMLSAYGTLPAFATPTDVKGNPGSPAFSCTAGVNTPGSPNGQTTNTPNSPNSVGGAGGGGAHNPNSQASANYPSTTTGGSAPHQGAQYDASCHQQSSNPGHSGP